MNSIKKTAHQGKGRPEIVPPFLAKGSGAERGIKPAERPRLVRIINYCKFAAHMGHQFTRATIYNRCADHKIVSTTIDGVRFVLLEKKTFDTDFKAWVEAQPA